MDSLYDMVPKGTIVRRVNKDNSKYFTVGDTGMIVRRSRHCWFGVMERDGNVRDSLIDNLRIESLGLGEMI